VTGRRCRGHRACGKPDASLSSFPGANEPDTALAAPHAEPVQGGCVGSGGQPLGGSRGGPVGRTPRSSSDRPDHSAGKGRTPGGNRLAHRSRTGMNPRAPALGARGWTITRGCAKKGMELLNRVPVIRPEGPGCPRLRALTPRRRQRERCIVARSSWQQRAILSSSGWSKIPRLQMPVDTQAPPSRAARSAHRHLHGLTLDAQVAAPPPHGLG
jgi:hypothetical protein